MTDTNQLKIDGEDVENQHHLTTTGKIKEKFFESNAGDGTTVYDQYLHGIPLFMCLGSCFATLFLIGLDQTIVITLFEEVGNKFNGYNKIGWISSGYMLTMAVFSATWGKMSIIFGRKWSLLLAILIFEAGSLMCGLANDMNVLIGGRILAGIGGGGIQTLVFIVCSELTPISKRPLVFIVLGLAFACSSVTGPLVGGAFTLHTTWRWCFYINLPIGGLAGVLLGIFFNPPKTKGSIREKLKLIDYLGTFLLTVGIVLFLLALTFGGVEFPWNSGAVISMFVLGGLIIILFCFWNFKYSKNPIIPLVIVKVPQVVFPVIALFLVFYCFMGIAVFISTYFQVIHGYGAWKTGVHMLPMIFPVVIGSMGSGILIRKTKHIKPYSVFGGLLGVVGIGCMLLLEVNSPASKKIGLLILPGFYVGIALQTCMMSSQLHAPKEAGSTILATSLLIFSRALGGAIGADLSQAIFNASYKNKMKAALKSSGGALNGLTADEASKLIARPSLIQSLEPDTKNAVLELIMKSIKNVFIVSTVIAGTSFVTMLFFSNKKIPKDSEIKKNEEEEKKLKEKEEEEEEEEEGALKLSNGNLVHQEDDNEHVEGSFTEPSLNEKKTIPDGDQSDIHGQH